MLRQLRTCLPKFHFDCVFLYIYCGSVVAKGTKTNWDGHNWGYIARTVPRDITMLGIYG